jgi:hypothetical protein
MTGASAHSLYTVPVGRRAIVRSWRAYQNAAGGGLALWLIDGVYGDKMQAPGDATFSANDLHWVYEAGEHIEFYTVTGVWMAQAHGYLLTA